ncbi:MAG TPA: hypothetical protein VIP28_15330 [Nocardioides sp.]
MTTVLVCLGLAALLVVLLTPRTRKTLVGGIFVRDRKGRMTIVLTPTVKKRRRRK